MLNNVDPAKYLYLAFPMPSIVISTNNPSPRLSYVCNIIFSSYFNVSYRFSDKVSENPDDINIIYGITDHKEKVISILNCGLLAETGICEKEIEVTHFEGLPAFFSTSDVAYSLPVDIFSMIFYLLSRYEEYFRTDLDKFGRYQSSQSLAVKNGFNHLPLVDLWIFRLADVIEKNTGVHLPIMGSYKIEATIDIDLPYAFRYKGWKTWLGGARDIVRIDWLTLLARINHLVNGEDPFDTYDYLRNICVSKGIQPTIFILNKNQKPYDENHLAGTVIFGEIIRKLSTWAEIGIHPSMSAGTAFQQIADEIQSVNKYLEYQIIRSRQHYIQLHIPDTYQSLISCGILHDFSMGYPDQIGFRASIARPFLWYDLANEAATELTIHPFTTMDVTMRHYLGMTPEIAIETIRDMREIIKKAGGTFSFIWHNSSLSSAYGWNGWRKVFEELLVP